MSYEPTSWPRVQWSDIPMTTSHGVQGRVLLVAEDVVVAQLRFEPKALLDEHSAKVAIDVVCLEGMGYVLVGEERYRLSAGESVHWPAGVTRSLYTRDSSMVTMMVERRR